MSRRPNFYIRTMSANAGNLGCLLSGRIIMYMICVCYENNYFAMLVLSSDNVSADNEFLAIYWKLHLSRVRGLESSWAE
jgi:hypothetical protein